MKETKIKEKRNISRFDSTKYINKFYFDKYEGAQTTKGMTGTHIKKNEKKKQNDKKVPKRRIELEKVIELLRV